MDASLAQRGHAGLVAAMTPRDLDRFLKARGGSVAIVLKNIDDGREVTVEFDRRALEYPHVWRATMRRHLGPEEPGWQPPELQRAEHDEWVRRLVAFVERDERRRRPPPPPRRRRRKRKGGRR